MTQSLGWKDPHGKGNGNLLQYSCMVNPRDRRIWSATVQGIAKSRTQLRMHNTRICRELTSLFF